jgi:hypothetical protein
MRLEAHAFIWRVFLELDSWREPEPRAHDENIRLVNNISTLVSLAVLGGFLLVAPSDEVSPRR